MIPAIGDIIYIREFVIARGWSLIPGYYVVTSYDGNRRIYVSPNCWKDRIYDYISTSWFQKEYNSHFAILKGEKILDKPLIV